MDRMPAISLAAVPGRRSATLELAVEIEKKGFTGIYCPSLGDSMALSQALALVTKEIDLPNGLGLSPDNKTLYVNKMALLDGDPRIISLNLETNESSILFDGKDLSESYEGNFDGMTVHSSGNIFTSGPGGLLVISPEGDLMAKIDFGHLTNATFDDDESYLYVTGFVNNPKVFRIKLK